MGQSADRNLYCLTSIVRVRTLADWLAGWLAGVQGRSSVAAGGGGGGLRLGQAWLLSGGSTAETAGCVPDTLDWHIYYSGIRIVLLTHTTRHT